MITHDIWEEAALGGTAEQLGGGKFANGAITGAYTVMFNHFLHDDPPKGEKAGIRGDKQNIRTKVEYIFFKREMYVEDGLEGSQYTKFEAGSHIRIEVKNRNFLGATVELNDISTYTYKTNWLGVPEKTFTGDSYSFVLMPFESKTFQFCRHVGYNYTWQFEISTKSPAVYLQLDYYKPK